MTRASETRWLSLREASSTLGVNQTTLRNWANQGRVRTFRTPGGHRRFSREDVAALMAAATRPANTQRPDGWPEAALDRMRRRLQRRKGQTGEWYDQFDDEHKSRMRVLGRRLVTLSTDYVTQKRRRSELSEEARFLGLEYGRELAAGQVKLRDAISAFIYFRNMLHDAIVASLGAELAGRDRAEVWQEVQTLEDTVLLAITEAYEKA